MEEEAENECCQMTCWQKSNLLSSRRCFEICLQLWFYLNGANPIGAVDSD